MSDAEARRILDEHPGVRAIFADVTALIGAQEALASRRPGDSFARTVGLYLEQTARDLLAGLPQEAADAAIAAARGVNRE
jgi:hypothetical protein